jgi:holo-[acyl-carrier protein] synthase
VIRGIGVDIAEIARFEAALARFGTRFPARILSETEMHEFAASSRPARFLAMRFAAKEATSKALGTGFKHGIAPRQISVVHAASGKPNLMVSGSAARLFNAHGVSMSHISLSDDGGFAIAFVVLEGA